QVGRYAGRWAGDRELIQFHMVEALGQLNERGIATRLDVGDDRADAFVDDRIEQTRRGERAGQRVGETGLVVAQGSHGAVQKRTPNLAICFSTPGGSKEVAICRVPR